MDGLNAITPSLIAGLVLLCGGEMRREGDRVVVRFRGGQPQGPLADDLRCAWQVAPLLKRGLLALLDHPEEERHAIIESALLREGLFLPATPPCRAFIGHAGHTHCLRCGATAAEHTTIRERGSTGGTT